MCMLRRGSQDVGEPATSTQQRSGSSTSGELPPTMYSYAELKGALACTAHVGTTTMPTGGGRVRRREAAASAAAAGSEAAAAAAAAAAASVAATELAASESASVSPAPAPDPAPAAPASCSATSAAAAAAAAVAAASSAAALLPFLFTFPRATFFTFGGGGTSTSLPFSSSNPSHCKLNMSSSNRLSQLRNVTPPVARQFPVARSSSPSTTPFSGSAATQPAQYLSNTSSPFGELTMSEISASGSTTRDSLMSSTSTQRQLRFDPGDASTVTPMRTRRGGGGCSGGGGSGPADFLLSLMGPPCRASHGFIFPAQLTRIFEVPSCEVSR